MSLAGKLIFLSIGWIAVATYGAGGLSFVDPMIGTEGDGSEYGGMMPYTCVPFGSNDADKSHRARQFEWQGTFFLACFAP